MMVSEPFSSTTAAGAQRRGPRGGQPVGAGIAEHAGELARMRGQHGGTAQTHPAAPAKAVNASASATTARPAASSPAAIARAPSRPGRGRTPRWCGAASCSSTSSGRSSTMVPGSPLRYTSPPPRGRDRHHARPAPPRRQRRQPRRPGHRRTAEHGDMAAGVFVPGRSRDRQAPQRRPIVEGVGPHRVEHRAGQSDIGQHQFAAQVAAGQQQVAGLAAEERHRHLGLRRIARAPARSPPSSPLGTSTATMRRAARNTSATGHPRRAPARRRTPRRSPDPRAPPRPARTAPSGPATTPQPPPHRPCAAAPAPPPRPASPCSLPAAAPPRSRRRHCCRVRTAPAPGTARIRARTARATARPAFSISHATGTPERHCRPSATAIWAGVSSSAGGRFIRFLHDEDACRDTACVL